MFKFFKSNNNNNQLKLLNLILNKSCYYLEIGKKLINQDKNKIADELKKNNKNKEEDNKINYIINNIINHNLNFIDYYNYLNYFLKEGDFKNFDILLPYISKYIYYLYEYKKKNVFNVKKSILFSNVYLDKEEIYYYKSITDQIICYPYFFSTSLDENYFQNNINNSKSINNSPKFHTTFIIEQNDSKSVISLNNINGDQNSAKYIFVPFTLFKINKVERKKNQEKEEYEVYLIALNSEISLEEMFEDFMVDETDNVDPRGLDMLQLTKKDTEIIINENLITKNNN